MGIVTDIKKYDRADVEIALSKVGYVWLCSHKKIPRRVEKMVEGLPRHHLEMTLFYLRHPSI